MINDYFSKKVYICLISIMVLLTGCGKEVKKEEVNTDYPRLPINEEIKNIEIGDDINDFMQLYSYILPEYNISYICYDEKDEYAKNSEFMEYNTIYVTNTSDCPREGRDDVATTSIFKINEIKDGTIYNIGMYQTDKKELVDAFGMKGCFKNLTIELNGKIYVLVLNVIHKDTNFDLDSSTYCPENDYFENEYLQYSNWIYDSFKQIEKQ